MKKRDRSRHACQEVADASENHRDGQGRGRQGLKPRRPTPAETESFPGWDQEPPFRFNPVIPQAAFIDPVRAIPEHRCDSIRQPGWPQEPRGFAAPPRDGCAISWRPSPGAVSARRAGIDDRQRDAVDFAHPQRASCRWQSQRPSVFLTARSHPQVGCAPPRFSRGLGASSSVLVMPVTAPSSSARSIVSPKRCCEHGFLASESSLTSAS